MGGRHRRQEPVWRGPGSARSLVIGAGVGLLGGTALVATVLAGATTMWPVLLLTGLLGLVVTYRGIFPR